MYDKRNVLSREIAKEAEKNFQEKCQSQLFPEAQGWQKHQNMVKQSYNMPRIKRRKGL